MRSGDRLVLAVFAAAVAAALAAIGWLVLGSPPPADTTPPVTGRGGTPPTVGVRPPEPGTPKREPKRPTRDPSRRTLHAVAGEVRRPDGSPAAGAEVLVYPPFVETGRDGPPGEGKGGGEFAGTGVDGELLRDLFDLEPEDLEYVTPYTGVPARADETAAPDPVARGTAGQDGTFRIVTQGRGPYRVEAGLSGVGRAVAGEVPADETPVILRLGSAVALTGRVLRSLDSAPVEGASVVIRAGPVLRSATTGGDGTFSFSGIHPGTYTVTAGAPGLAPATVPSVEASAESRPVEVVIGTGFSVRVQVMRWETPPPGWRRTAGNPLPPGPPVEGATVVLLRVRSDDFVTGTTGADGSAVIEGLGEGHWRVGVRARGFNVGIARDIVLKPGSPAQEVREVRLFPEVETVVRAMDETGAPIRGAKVYTGGLDEGFDARYSRLVGTTDDMGAIKFVFDDGVPRKAVLWIVPEGGGAATMVEPEDSSSGQEEKVVIRPGRVIKGSVRDPAGRPVAGASVYANVWDDERDIDFEYYVYTDAQGRYEFPPVPFGEVSLEVDTDVDFDTVDLDPENRDNPLVRDFVLETEEE